MTLQPAYRVCGLDFAKSDTGDAGAVIVIIVPILAFWVEFRFNPPPWVHAVLWPSVTLPLSVVLTRPMKAALVAARFRTWPHEMGL